MALFSALLEEKAPIKQSLPSICTNTLCPGATEGKSYFTPFYFNFLALICFFSPFLLFYKLSLLLTDVTAFPLYFILSSSVTSQAQLLLLLLSWVSQSCWTWDVSLYHTSSHFHTISSIATLPCEWNGPSINAEYSNHLRNGWSLLLKRICMLQFILTKYT